MRPGYTITLLLMLCTLMSACGSREGVLEGVPVKVVWEEQWCESDAMGRLDYESVFPGEVSPVVNGCFWAEDSAGLVGVYRATVPARPIARLQGLKSAGYYSEGVIPVFTADGELRVCDGFGRERFHLSEIGGAKIVAASAMYSEGVLCVGNERGLWGAVDKDGNLKVSVRYSSEFTFCNGYAEVTLPAGMGDGATVAVIDRQGREVIRPHYTVPGTVMSVNDTYIIYSDYDGHRGLATTSGRILLAPRYNSLEFGVGGLLLASNAQRYFLIDKRGNIVSDFDNADEVVGIGRWSNGAENGFGYAARFGSLWTLYDRTGCRTGMYDYVAISCEVIEGPEPIRVTGRRGVGRGNDASLWSDGIAQFEADSISVVPDTAVFGTGVDK